MSIRHTRPGEKGRERAGAQRDGARPGEDEEATITGLGKRALEAFAAAVDKVRQAPGDLAMWRDLESKATAPQHTEEIAALYREVLTYPLAPSVIVGLAERAARFHDEWVEDPENLVQTLERVLRVDPTAPWALDRASLLFTTLARWDELLAFYDRAIAATTDGARRAGLLEEAAHVAKDCAGQVDRAIAYLGQLFELDPANKESAASLERLLTQQKRFTDLIDFWTRRIGTASAREAVELRERIAVCRLDNMDDPGGTLAVVEPLLAEPPAADVACKLLERILVAKGSTTETRQKAIDLLRRHYDASGRAGDVIRVLQNVLELVTGRDRVEVHAELARRLVEQGRDDDALDHFAALIVHDPDTCDDAMLTKLLSDKYKGTFAGCKPRIDRARGRELLHRAARAATSTPGARDRAVHLYRLLLKDAPDDLVAITRLATVFETSGERAELRDLRRRELEVVSDVARRLELRLEIARLSDALGDPAGRLDALRQNLDEKADHRKSIHELVGALEAEGRIGELCDLLTAHANKLQTMGVDDLAAELWTRAAEVAERGLKALRRAVQCYERVVGIAPTPAVLESLARIHGELGDHATAVRWLEQCTALVSAEQRNDVILRLAQAHVASGHKEEALASLERGLAGDSSAAALREMQTDLLRGAKDWEALVTALLEGARHAEAEGQRAYLREAADVLSRKLRAPERAVPILEQAVQEGDREVSVRAELADALRRVGRLDEARSLAEALVHEFGRRRPPERAAVHLTLARTLRAQGDVEGAIRELEHAVGMDIGNATAQRMLGDLCREAGLLDRAERAYQALLLIQKRERGQPSEGAPTHAISETLFQLHRVAEALGDSRRAAETLASAFDIAHRSEHEARRLERALRKAGKNELLLYALDLRLMYTDDPAARVALLGETTSLLESLDRPVDALDRALKGIAMQPDSADLHGRARALSVRSQQVPRYVVALQAAVDGAIQAGRHAAACENLLRLGAVYEDDLGQLDAASAAYERAEATSENMVEVWRRMVRVAAARGDRATRLAVLRKLADALEDTGSVEERAEALYALADEELQTAETLDAGLATLTLALETQAQHGAAVKALRKALRIATDPEPIVRLYVTVARASGDDATLLDALMAASRLQSPAQDTLQEAYALAGKVGAHEQAARLLERAVDAAREGTDPGEALWAMRHLADERERAGDLPAAIIWMSRAAEAADADESTALLMRVAALAADPVGDLDLAYRTYERLRERDPANPDVWRPLLDVLRAMDDAARLEVALDRIADVVPLPKDRNRLRMERARILLRWPDRGIDVLEVLRSVLDEEPEHDEAAGLLADLLQAAGGHEELAALLTRQLDAARDRKDFDAGAALALRLGGDLLVASRKAEALDVYRSVLEWAPERPDVLRALIALLDGADEAAERADRMEKLVTCETGAERFDLAIELARVRRSLTDAAGVERALSVAWSTDPGHPELRGRMRSLADATILDASDHPRQAGPLLYKAAMLLRDKVGDAAAALDVLQNAVAAQPDDMRVLDLLVRCAIETGQLDKAKAAFAAALERSPPNASQQATLFRLRGLVAAASNEHAAAWADLERAYALGGESALPDLLDALPRARSDALERGGLTAERPLALRQAELMVVAGQADASCEVLAEWVGRCPDDREALHRLVELDTAAGRWDDVAEGYARLLDLESGPKLAEVAVALADACERAGRPSDGRVGLERVFQSDPANPQVRGRLRDLYARTGSDRELANVLLMDARHATDDAARFELLREAGRLRLQSLQEGAAAIGPLSEALELRPTDQPVTLLLADAYVAAGLVDEATELLRTAIGQRGSKRSRELAELQHRMASLADNRRSELSWLVAAFESFPKSPEICNDLARLATEEGQYEVALKGLRSLVAIKDSSPTARAQAYVMQAHIATLQSDDRRAVFLVKKALGEDPKLPEAIAMLDRLEGRA